MYHKIACRVVSILHRNNDKLDDPDLQEISAYGIEITLSSAVNVLLIILIGLLYHSLLSSVLFIALFNPIRKYIGGYHCTTYLRCNITYCTIFLIVVGLSKVLYERVNICSFLLLLLICGYGVWFLGPVENSHKPVTKQQQLRCHIIAKWIFLFDAVAAIMCYIWSTYLGLAAAFSLLAMAVLLPLGTLAERRRAYETEEQNREKAD